MASRWAVASWSDCPPERNAMPGTPPATHAFNNPLAVPPPGEPRAAFGIVLQPVGEAVETRGDEFARAIRQSLRSLVDLDARNGAGLFDQSDQRRAVLGVLPDRFVIEDDARDVPGHR